MKRLALMTLSSVMALLITLKPTASFAVDEGTNIIGTDETPNSLNLVPWQSRELGVDPWGSRPTFESQLLKDSLKPIDEDELRRQVEYFNLLQHSAPQAVEQ